MATYVCLVQMGYETSRYRLITEFVSGLESRLSKSKRADLVISSALRQHIHMGLGMCTLAMIRVVDYL